MTKSSKTKILVVDDDPTIIMAITRWLTKQDYTPIAAYHANEAKDIIASQNVDLALIDVRLPEIDGLELSQHILSLDANIPILLITAFADLDTAREALDMGIYEYITKPFDFVDLNASIKRGLQHQKLVAESRFYQAKLDQAVAERTEKLTQINAQLQSEIDERKKIERQLVQFERLAALAEMSEGVSHNLNNILTGILGPAQLIELHTDNKEILRETEIIQKAAIRASDLIKRLSVSVKGESGELEAVPVDTLIDEALQATKPRWKDEAEANGVEITIEKDIEAPNAIRGTKPGFYNILLSLILNAIDAQPSGGTIAISAKNVDDVVEIQLTDQGIGMREDIRRRVFEPFFTTKSEVGKGLSLSSAYASITRWGGSIHLESKPNAGTTVTIQLPAWKPPQSNTNAGIPQATRSANVLVVEDEQIVRTFLARTLSPHHQVDVATDGVQALELFAKKQYDVVLVDLGMPHLPGDQVVQRMRDISPQVSAILITGWHLSTDDPRYQVFDFHLQKPFESVDLITTCVAQAIQVYDNRKKNTL